MSASCGSKVNAPGDAGEAGIEDSPLDLGLDSAADSPADAGVDQSLDSGMCNGPKLQGVIAWWKGENNLLDETGSVALAGSAAYAVAKVGKGIDLSTNSLKGTASPGLDGLTAVTIEGWLYVRTDNRVVATRRFNTGYQFEVAGLYLAFAVNCGASACTGNSVNAITLNAFYHVAVTYDSKLNAKAMQFYINGVPAGLVNGSGNGAGTIPNDMATIYVGSIQTGMAPFFDGIIDELAIYNRVLTPAEIASIYTAGSTGKCK